MSVFQDEKEEGMISDEDDDGLNGIRNSETTIKSSISSIGSRFNKNDKMDSFKKIDDHGDRNNSMKTSYKHLSGDEEVEEGQIPGSPDKNKLKNRSNSRSSHSNSRSRSFSKDSSRSVSKSKSRSRSKSSSRSRSRSRRRSRSRSRSRRRRSYSKSRSRSTSPYAGPIIKDYRRGRRGNFNNFNRSYRGGRRPFRRGFGSFGYRSYRDYSRSRSRSYSPKRSNYKDRKSYEKEIDQSNINETKAETLNPAEIKRNQKQNTQSFLAMLEEKQKQAKMVPIEYSKSSKELQDSQQKDHYFVSTFAKVDDSLSMILKDGWQVIDDAENDSVNNRNKSENNDKPSPQNNKSSNDTKDKKEKSHHKHSVDKDFKSDESHETNEKSKLKSTVKAKHRSSSSSSSSSSEVEKEKHSQKEKESKKKSKHKKKDKAKKKKRKRDESSSSSDEEKSKRKKSKKKKKSSKKKNDEDDNRKKDEINNEEKDVSKKSKEVNEDITVEGSSSKSKEKSKKRKHKSKVSSSSSSSSTSSSSDEEEEDSEKEKSKRRKSKKKRKKKHSKKRKRSSSTSSSSSDEDDDTDSSDSDAKKKKSKKKHKKQKKSKKSKKSKKENSDKKKSSGSGKKKSKTSKEDKNEDGEETNFGSWPTEIIQYTATMPSLQFSINPKQIEEQDILNVSKVDNSNNKISKLDDDTNNKSLAFEYERFLNEVIPSSTLSTEDSNTQSNDYLTPSEKRAMERLKKQQQKEAENEENLKRQNDLQSAALSAYYSSKKISNETNESQNSNNIDEESRQNNIFEPFVKTSKSEDISISFNSEKLKKDDKIKQENDDNKLTAKELLDKLKKKKESEGIDTFSGDKEKSNKKLQFPLIGKMKKPIKKSSSDLSSESYVNSSGPTPQTMNADYNYYYQYYISSFGLDPITAAYYAQYLMLTGGEYQYSDTNAWMQQQGYNIPQEVISTEIINNQDLSTTTSINQESTEDTNQYNDSEEMVIDNEENEKEAAIKGNNILPKPIEVIISSTPLSANELYFQEGFPINQNNDFDDDDDTIPPPPPLPRPTISTFITNNSITLPNGQTFPAGSTQIVVHPYPKSHPLSNDFTEETLSKAYELSQKETEKDLLLTDVYFKQESSKIIS